MNIPDEVIEQAAQDMYRDRPLNLDQEDDEWETLPESWQEEWREGVRSAAPALVEWARREALREAANKFQASFPVYSDKLRALAEGEQG